MKVAAAAIAVLPVIASAQPLPRSKPEAQGVSSRALVDLVDTFEAKIDHLHSLMVVRHGHVVAEGWWKPYAADKPHMLFSLSKSFTSTAVGMLQTEGKLSINDRLVQYFPEAKSTDPANQINEMRLRDMLCMSTGQSEADIDRFPFGGGRPSVAFLGTKVGHKPGTLWHYNTPATYMLSYVAQKTSGQTLADYLMPRLFEPLGIAKPQWDQSDEKVDWGGFGLNLRTEDVAKMGQMLLRRGEYGGKRLVPAAWVDLATSKQASNGSDPDSDWSQGYGFQFWRCRHGAYRGDGAFCQFMVVMPEQDCVVAITSGSNDYQGVLNVLWDKLLPELRPAPLPDDAEGDARLAEKMKSLVLPPVIASARPADGLPFGKEFRFAKNDWGLSGITLMSGGRGPWLSVEMTGAKLAWNPHSGTWTDGGEILGRTHPNMGDGAKHISVSGGWTAPQVMQVKVCYDTTPFVDTWTLDFTGGTLKATLQHNVAFGPTNPAVIPLK
ncbi:MAG: serine hydrolase [Fimbriimonadaceae bacterium]|nr:serine hydrolase [Fimbriimonadaceae bacterium]